VTNLNFIGRRTILYMDANGGRGPRLLLSMVRLLTCFTRVDVKPSILDHRIECHQRLKLLLILRIQNFRNATLHRGRKWMTLTLLQEEHPRE
jgi:hypothetical protein